MILTRLSLADFRNYAELQLEPAPGLNVFVGANAQGKSNLLEAIALLGTGKSFRTNKEGDVIRVGAQTAGIGGDARVRAGVVHLSCAISTTPRGTRKTYALNGQSVRYSAFLGKARVVTFVPADLALVGGSPSARRALFNAALAQEQPSYYHELARYHKTVAQKNALLRADDADADLLAIYNATLVESGTALMLARARFATLLRAAARDVHALWSAGAETLEVRYHPSVTFDEASPAAIAAAFEARLRERADAERARKTSLVGPHRDDLLLELNGTSLAAYGSQGQQRTAVLALKVAEYRVLHERTGEAPLLLLDDVLSELDEARARAFLQAVGGFEQAFVTATHLPEFLPDARVWNVEGEQLRQAQAV